MEKLLRNKTAIILFMAPTLILFTAILLVPIGTSFYYALGDYDKTIWQVITESEEQIP